MSLKDLPHSHFKVAVEELNHRYKVCIALGSLVEEVAEVGSSAGKSLSKLGAPSFQTGNHQWLPTCSVALESIYKMTTTSTGKQLAGHSSNLSQNISKTFPEHVRLGKKRVGVLSNKITTQVDEYKKAKLLHAKNYEKYLRLAADTEAAIKSRVAANDTESRNNSDKEPQVVQGDNFMNRSLNKMLSKIAPEKKLDDKCKDMVRELDLNERAVVASNKRLIVMRGDLLNEISKTMVELEELETQRLTLMKEGLSRFCLAADLIANQQGEVIASVLERTDRLVALDEAAQLMKEIDRPMNASNHNNHSPLKKRSDSSDTEAEDVDTAAELTVLFSKAEKLGEAIDYFRSLVVRATNSMLEVAEVDATYSRSAQKVLDRHGYCRNSASHWVYAADYSTIPMLAEIVPIKSAPLSAAIGAVGATTLALTSNLRSAEFLSRFESPDTKAGWEHVVGCLGNFSDLQMRTSEVVGDEVCQQLELVTQRLEIGRKELTDKLAQNTKMVDSARQEVKKISLKLTKCQALLRERRDTVKQVKEILIVDAMDNTAASTETPSTAAAAVLNATGLQDNNNERDVVGSPESSSVLGSTLDEPLSSPVPLAAGDSYSRKQGIFRKGGLKQVVGLETQADRVSRIEKQVSTLEEEERDLIEALASAEQALLSVTSVAKTQVLPIFDATREFISTDLVTVKSTIKALMNWKSEALDSSRNANRLAKTSHDEINITKDLTAFVTAVQTTAKGIPKDQAQPSLNTQMANALQGLPLTLLDVPELDTFQVFQSELITQEREVISRMAPVPSTLYSISNLAMNYAGQSDSSAETSPGPGGYSVFKTRDRKGTEDSISSTHGVSAAAADTSVGTEPDSASSATDGFHQPVPLDSMGQELAKFGLGSQDKVLESYSCALYPKKGMLAHGRMFVTQHYLAFSGWPDTRVLLLIRNIAEVERMNTLYYVPNALSVKMDDDSEYFFGSFIDRELCYALLVNLSEVGRRTASMPDFDQSTERRTLEFGYQTQNNLFGGGEEVAHHNEDGVPVASGSPGVRASPGGFRSASPSALMAAMQGAVTPLKPVVAEPSPTRPATRSESASAMLAKLTRSVSTAAPATPAKEVPAPSPAKPIAVAASPTPVPAPAAVPVSAPSTTSQSVDTSSSLSSNTSETAASTASSVPPVVKVVKPVLPEWVEVEDGVDQNALFERNNISVMQEKVFSLSCEEIWAATWAHCNSHAGFLLEEGELDITFTEWVPCTSPKVPEDVAKLSYCFTRQLNYNHPRTTMLMFGPKNAPTGQVQYLYLPIGSKKLTPSELMAARPSRGVVFQLTTLQGIPMCDVFKICQYWSFTRHGGEVGRTEMKIGMAIHYVKSTMFKAQIYGGTKEELTIMSLKWLQYAEKCCLNKAAVLPADVVTEEQTVQTTEPGSGEKIQVRRSSFKRTGSPGPAPVGIAAVATTTAASLDVSVGTSELLKSSTASSAVATSTPAELKAVVTVAPSTKPVAQAAQHQPHGEFALQMHVDVNYVLIILACAVLVLMVLLYRQSSHNSALVQQINLLSRKIELSQTAMEISLRQSQGVVQKMEAFINNMQK